MRSKFKDDVSISAQPQTPPESDGPGTASDVAGAVMTTQSRSIVAAEPQAATPPIDVAVNPFIAPPTAPEAFNLVSTKPSEMKLEGTVSIKIGSSEVQYAETWVPDAEKWFDRLRDEVPWSPENIMMYGKPLVLRRETCNYGEDYEYNKLAKPAVPWAGPVLELKTMLEEYTGRVYTQCACNLYPDGETGIGLHHDKRHPVLVASISFGAVRAIGFAPKRGKLDKSLPMIPLASGSLLMFPDAINDNYKHTIVEERSVRGPRISVTFREFAANEEKGKKVTRQMSPNSALPAITAPAFQSVADFVNAYETTDKTIADRTGKFVGAIDEAKQKQDDIVPYLSYMQSLLSKKGSNHHLVTEARKNGKNIPWWTDYYEKYKNRLWESLRTMERRIDAYRKDPSVPRAKPGSGKGKHLTQLEHKLLGTATTVHEALTDINAGRIDDAVKKLKSNLPTQDRIDEYLDRGVKLTLVNPDGSAKPQPDNSQLQAGSTVEPPPLSSHAPATRAAPGNTAIPAALAKLARVECADHKDPLNRDKNGRLVVECFFVMSDGEKVDFMKSVEKLGHVRSTQLMWAAPIKEARGQSDDI